MNTLFWVAFIVEAIFGLGYVLIPGPMAGMISVTLDPIIITTLRILGSALIGFATLLWFARKSNTAEFKKGAVYSLFAYFSVSTVLLLIAQLGGLMNAMGWSLVGLHVILSVWFGYFLVK